MSEPQNEIRKVLGDMEALGKHWRECAADTKVARDRIVYEARADENEHWRNELKKAMNQPSAAVDVWQSDDAPEFRRWRWVAQFAKLSDAEQFTFGDGEPISTDADIASVLEYAIVPAGSPTPENTDRPTA